jgi:predicted GNAT family acetyltransferase
MDGFTNDFTYIRCLTKDDQAKIDKIPFLNIDSILIPSPYIKDKELDIDYDHSYVWDEEGEFLGYILVYSNKEKNKFLVYKQVTSPFGRGKGIGSAFIRKLAQDVSPDSYIYLFVWEKLASTIGSPEQLFSSRSQARLMLCDNKSATMATARCVANSDI